MGRHNGEIGSRLDPTFPRAELQGSSIGQTYPMEEGGSLAVINWRTEEESPAVISWGPEQILRYRVMRWHRYGGTTSRGHQKNTLLRLYSGCHTNTGVILVHQGSIGTV